MRTFQNLETNPDRIVAIDTAFDRICDPLSMRDQTIYAAVMRIGAAKRNQKRKQKVRDLRGEDILAAAWLIAAEYPDLDVVEVIRRAIRLSIKQGRQIASREVSEHDPIRSDYSQDIRDNLLDIVYTLTSELDKTYRVVDGQVLALGQLMRQGYNQVRAAALIGVDSRSVRKRIASVRKMYNSMFSDA